MMAWLLLYPVLSFFVWVTILSFPVDVSFFSHVSSLSCPSVIQIPSVMPSLRICPLYSSHAYKAKDRRILSLCVLSSPSCLFPDLGHFFVLSVLSLTAYL